MVVGQRAHLAFGRRHEAVICTSDAHINVDECGAPERIAGMKLCRASSFGLMPTAQLRIFFDARESEGRTQFKSISLALSPDLKEIRWAWSLSPALLVVLVLGSAALGSMGRRSPGKGSARPSEPGPGSG